MSPVSWSKFSWLGVIVFYLVYPPITVMFSFQINDMGHLSEAIMTKSFVNPRQRQYFQEKKKVCAFSHSIFFVSVVIKIQIKSNSEFAYSSRVVVILTHFWSVFPLKLLKDLFDVFTAEFEQNLIITFKNTFQYNVAFPA